MNVAKSIEKPLAIQNYVLKNRIVVPPMADIALTIPQGYVNDSLRRRYAAYAEGGAGLIMVEGSNVTHMPDVRDAIALWDDTYIPGLQTLAQTVKKKRGRRADSNDEYRVANDGRRYDCLSICAEISCLSTGFCARGHSMLESWI